MLSLSTIKAVPAAVISSNLEPSLTASSTTFPPLPTTTTTTKSSSLSVAALPGLITKLEKQVPLVVQDVAQMVTAITQGNVIGAAGPGLQMFGIVKDLISAISTAVSSFNALDTIQPTTNKTAAASKRKLLKRDLTQISQILEQLQSSAILAKAADLVNAISNGSVIPMLEEGAKIVSTALPIVEEIASPPQSPSPPSTQPSPPPPTQKQPAPTASRLSRRGLADKFSPSADVGEMIQAIGSSFTRRERQELMKLALRSL